MYSCSACSSSEVQRKPCWADRHAVDQQHSANVQPTMRQHCAPSSSTHLVPILFVVLLYCLLGQLNPLLHEVAIPTGRQASGAARHVGQPQSVACWQAPHGSHGRMHPGLQHAIAQAACQQERIGRLSQGAQTDCRNLPLPPAAAGYCRLTWCRFCPSLLFNATHCCRPPLVCRSSGTETSATLPSDRGRSLHSRCGA